MRFIGQKSITRRIKRLLKGARAQGVRLPHSILAGLSGFGKTELARQIAAALGVTFIEIHAGKNCNEAFWAIEAARWAQFDIIFIDEIHRLPPYIQEVLYTIIDRRLAPKLVEGSQHFARPKTNGLAPVADVTIIAATDQPGALNNALKKRFQEELVFQPYTIGELRLITRLRASEAGILLSPQAIGILARASRGNPRVAGHLISSLKAMHDAAALSTQFTAIHIRKFLRLKGIRPDGATQKDLAYLQVLHASKSPGVSLRLLTTTLNTDRADVERGIEPWLIQAGLVTITRHGRRLTDKGRSYCQAVFAASPDTIQEQQP